MIYHHETLTSSTTDTKHYKKLIIRGALYGFFDPESQNAAGRAMCFLGGDFTQRVDTIGGLSQPLLWVRVRQATWSGGEFGGFMWTSRLPPGQPKCVVWEARSENSLLHERVVVVKPQTFAAPSPHRIQQGQRTDLGGEQYGC